ncbi:putative Ser/Thr protein kinase [Streptosporangium album]|uniref:Putative Ser/Thr protein kinase n=1 Tax=Streptosporangium album TaxID=47479 RepID=A0A7W7RSC1_9ACTN|nr:serine/threonine-protein kinase [Streptosporangium album]MBB4937284.1 putative Ser/Thr protein kinase [Streptosporangium album]
MVLASGDPERVGPYKVLSRLGGGGMGTVYLGEDAEGRHVAIKVINRGLAHREEFRRRFRREVEAARSVRRFCTAAVLDACLDGDEPYVVTEYVPGPTLGAAVSAEGPLDGSSLETLAVNVATALAAIHAAGIVHRDLKPANVLLSSAGPLVIDFGIARILGDLDELTETGGVVGTPHYLAPELLRGEPVTPLCDVYSWGCLLVFAATGRPPFEGETVAALLHRALYDEPRLDGLEPALREVVAAALDKDPAARPSAEALLRMLTGAESPTAPSRRARRFTGRRVLVSVFGVLAVSGIAAWSVYGLAGRGTTGASDMSPTPGTEDMITPEPVAGTPTPAPVRSPVGRGEVWVTGPGCSGDAVHKFWANPGGGEGWKPIRGGWNRDGCDQSALSTTLSGSEKWNETASWYVLPGPGSSCALELYVPDDPRAAGTAVFYVTSATQEYESKLGYSAIDQAAHRGRWVMLGTFDTESGDFFVNFINSSSAKGRESSGPRPAKPVALSAMRATCRPA